MLGVIQNKHGVMTRDPISPQEKEREAAYRSVDDEASRHFDFMTAVRLGKAAIIIPQKNAARRQARNKASSLRGYC